MPLHRYEPATSPCRLCGDGFDHAAPADAAPLATCPTCGQLVRRATVHAITTPKLSRPASVSTAKQAGFSVYKRTAAGEYERQ